MQMRDDFFAKNRERRFLLGKQAEVEVTGDKEMLAVYGEKLKQLEEELKRLIFWCDIDVRGMHHEATTAEQRKENEEREAHQRNQQAKAVGYDEQTREFNAELRRRGTVDAGQVGEEMLQKLAEQRRQEEEEKNKATFTHMLFQSGLDLNMAEDAESIFTYDFEMPGHDRSSHISDHPGSRMSMEQRQNKRLASTRLKDLLRMGTIKKVSANASRPGSRAESTLGGRGRQSRAPSASGSASGSLNSSDPIKNDSSGPSQKGKALSLEMKRQMSSRSILRSRGGDGSRSNLIASRNVGLAGATSHKLSAQASFRQPSSR